MLLLTSISDVIRLVTSLAVSTIEVHTSWVDKIGTTDSTPERQNTSITTATTTTIVPAPAVGVQRNVRLITITNDSATACPVDIEHFNGTAVSLRKFLIQAGDTLQYTTAKGFEVLINTAVKTYVPPVSVVPVPFVRATIVTQIAGQYTSLWRGTGLPAQGAIPTVAEVCSNATIGAIPLATRTGTQKRLITSLEVAPATAGTTTILVDRLVQRGGLSGTVATAQTINADASLATFDLPNRIGSPDFSSVEWFMEWYTATGATAVTPSFAVTHGDNTTGLASIFNLGSPTLPASVAASRMYQIIATSGKPIKSIQTVTMPTTGTAGNFGVTAVKRLRTSQGLIANSVTPDKVAVTDAMQISDNACLNAIVLCVATATGVIRGATVQTVVA